MDVFEALGLDVPETASMSLGATDPAADPGFMQTLSSIFGWTEKEASANSLILFPGDSQQGLGDGGLREVPSVNDSQQARQEQGVSSAGGVVAAAQPAQKVSPFSGISQFDLFLGDPAPSPAAAAAGGGGALGGQTEATAAPQSGLPFGLLGLLQDSQDVQEQQQQPEEPPQPQPKQEDESPFALQHPNLQQGLAAGGASLLALQQQQQQQQVLMPPPLPQQQQVLMPPPVPQLPLQQQPGLLMLQQQPLQPQVISPLLLQPQQLHLQQVQHLGLPGQPDIMPPQPLQQLLQQQQLQQQPLQQPLQQQPLQSPILQQPWQQPTTVKQEDVEQQMNNADAGGAADPVQQAGQQPKRRGRPPKNPGQYSKGYEAIKRYREKKKGMVEHMEAEVAEKRQELQRLLAEQEALRSHQQQLESTMDQQDQLLAQLLQLKLEAAGKEDSNVTPDLEATTAAAMAGVQQALAMQNGGDTAAAQAAAAAAVAERRSKVLLKQQQMQQKVMEEGPVFLRRYQAYVQAVADRLSCQGGGSDNSSSTAAAAAAVQQQGGQQGVQPSSSTAPGGGAAPFPPFPFTLNETLSLWTLSRLAIMTRATAMQREGAAGVSDEVWDDFTLNLSTGQHDLVPNELWKGVGEQIAMTGEQQVQLRAAWRVYVSAMDNMNQERQVLLQQLQQAMAAEEAGQQQPQQPGAGQAGAAGSSSGSAGAAAAAATAGSSGVNRSTASSLDAAFVYLDLLDAIDRNLLRGRAVVMMFGWSILCMLSAEQIGRICVVSWPYFPLIRAVVGYMLGKNDLTP